MAEEITEKKNSKTLMYVAIVIVLLALAGVLYYTQGSSSVQNRLIGNPYQTKEASNNIWGVNPADR